jgi:hypothetical protein
LEKGGDLRLRLGKGLNIGLSKEKGKKPWTNPAGYDIIPWNDSKMQGEL